MRRPASPSPAPDLRYHHSNINEDVFIERSQDMLIDRWVCSLEGHTICFTGCGLHRPLSDDDIQCWAASLAAGNTTLHRPPRFMLEPWTQLQIITRASHSAPSIISSSSSYDSILPGIGYFAGSGIKGIGNIVIGGMAAGDTVFRKARLSMRLRLMRLVRRRAKATALHKLAIRIAFPGRNLNGLLNDIIEYMQLQGRDMQHSVLAPLANSMSLRGIPMSLYARMKWLFIIANCTSGWGVHRSTTKWANGQAFFLQEFDNDELASSEAQRFLQKELSPCESGVQQRISTWQRLVTLLIIQSDERRGVSRPAAWTDMLDILPILPMRYPSSSLNAATEFLQYIRLRDQVRVLDGEQTPKHSLWECACAMIRTCVKHIRGFDRTEDYATCCSDWQALQLVIDTLEKTHPSGTQHADVVALLFDAAPFGKTYLALMRVLQPNSAWITKILQKDGSALWRDFLKYKRS